MTTASIRDVSRLVRHGGWVVVVMAIASQWQFAVKALVHLAASITLGDHAPGAVTGAVVSIPPPATPPWA
jgi:hypothetical protein